MPVRALGVALGLLYGAFATAAEPPAAPDLTEVAVTVEAYFDSLDDFQPGDLIRRSHIEEVLVRLADAGWNVAGAEQIVRRGLADDSFLVKRLSTPKGRQFMRKIAGMPGGYSHLDRLSTISGGQTLVDDLIRRRGGADLIRYLTTTSGGRQLSQQMAGTPQGVDLNNPTRRIYTADDLLFELMRVGSKR